MTKKKSFITFLFAFCLIIPAMFMFTACGSNILSKLSNDNGFVVEGGDFAEGVVLEANVIDSTSDEYEQTMTLIASESYDDTKPVYVFEISVKKDNVKVQPNGKVKVSVPVSADLTGYDVLHIKDNNTIERLTVTYKNGIASFETDSFLTFVFVATGTINPIQTADSEAEWNTAINYWKAQNNVRVLEDTTTKTGYHSYNLYQFNGTTISEEMGYEAGEKSKAGRYYMSDGALIEYQSDWVKLDGWLSSYNWARNSYIYGWVLSTDGVTDVMADFTYANFTYDEATNSYKNSTQNTEVSFEFNNNVLSKLVIKYYGNAAVASTTRTITFTGIDINVLEAE